MAKDEPPLLFRRQLGSLRPANKAAEEAVAFLSDGAIRVRITKTTGNVRRNALYWACLAIAAPILSDKIEGDPLSPEMLHSVLKDRYGLVRVITLPSGDIVKDYDSTSFASMSEPDRAKFVDWALSAVSKWIGCSVEVLLREGEFDR